MLDMGFAPQLKRIMQTVPEGRQTMLFSATMPDAIVNIAKAFMKLPVRVEVARSGTTASNITQEVIFVPKNDKPTVLKQLLESEPGSVLVFTRTKFGAKKVAKMVRDWGVSSSELHSNRSLSQRFASLAGFKTNKYRVLVATDIAARGIDAAGIALVVNYDLPAVAEDYVHRIGRTGRAGRSGKAISLASPDQRRDVKDIERLIGQMLPAKHIGTSSQMSSIASPEPREYSRPFRSAPQFGGRARLGSSGAPRGGRAPFKNRLSMGATTGRPKHYGPDMRFKSTLPSGSSRRGRAYVSR